jgi:hypothetical protein
MKTTRWSAYQISFGNAPARRRAIEREETGLPLAGSPNPAPP